VFGRRKSKTRAQLMRGQLARTYAQLQAAGMRGAGRTAGRLWPRYAAARDFVSPRAVRLRNRWLASVSAVSPVLAAVRVDPGLAYRAAARARGVGAGAGRMNRRRGARTRKWPLLVGGMLAGGAAAGAYTARKRRAERLSDDAVVAIVEDAEGIPDATVMRKHRGGPGRLPQSGF
jgi:hypothetical protein